MDLNTLEWQDAEALRDNATTPRPQHINATPAEYPYPQYTPYAPRTPEPTESAMIYQPPAAPKENIGKFRIRRRRTNGPLAEQLHTNFSSSETLVPSIELSQAQAGASDHDARPMTPMNTSLLSPSLGHFPFAAQHAAPPKTPISQISTSFASFSTRGQEWSPTPRLDASYFQRPSSALSVQSDSSASSVSSSDTSPSFGGSCTSPESDTADPFSFPDYASKPSGLASPFEESSKPRKRTKTSNHVKWTADMDEHLWKTYLAYQTNPEVTPFKALPGVAPPLGVCHRVAREAKRSWRGPRVILQPISEFAGQSFESIDAVMRETSAPPELLQRGGSNDTLRPEALLRPHSSNSNARRSTGRWPRSEASTRKRLRELCKSKPNLPAHYQRLMRTRSPSPFGSSSSSARRSSRLSPSPRSKRQDSSSFATDDLKLSLTAHTMSSMQPGNALYQLASEPPVATPRHQYNTWSSSSTSRSSHQKSQSLPYGPSPNNRATTPRARLPLASPFHVQHENPFANQPASSSHPQPESSDGTATAPGQTEEPWQIHAPRPMSGSMKRRADFDLGDEQNSHDLLQNLFPSHIATTSDGNKRLRARTFSAGAVRYKNTEGSRQSSRQLAELFSAPPEEDIYEVGNAQNNGKQADASAAPAPPLASVGQMIGLGRLAPPSAWRPPRLRSPFAPVEHAGPGMSNTFPRSLFPQGLDRMSNLEHGRQQMSLQQSIFGSDGSNDEHGEQSHDGNTMQRD